MKYTALCVALTVAFGLLAEDLPTPPPWPQEPTDFRKVPFGSSPSELEATLKAASCRTLNGRFGCIYQGTIGDVSTSEIYLFDATKTKMERVLITFPSDKYSFVRDVFVERYGQPLTSKVEPYKTRGGAEFENEALAWLGEAMLVTLDRYGSNLKDGFAMVASRAAIDASDKAAEEKKKKAARSF